MKYRVETPFLWFKRGQEVDFTSLPRLDPRYLERKKVITPIAEKPKPKPKPKRKDTE